MKYPLFRLTYLMALVLCLTSCDDFLDITPTGKVIAQTGEEYRAMLTYEYKNFPKDRYLTTVRTDELTMSKASTSSADLDAYLDLWLWKDDNPAVTTTYFYYRSYYHAIYIANYVIEHQQEITHATAAEISQMVGEAYMMRAYCHFLLANLYAEPYTHCSPATTRGIPMLLEADVNAVPSSSSLEAVYLQVLKDIDEAERCMNVKEWETGKNYRFNTTSAQAFRARVHLYMGHWQEALTAALAVIDEHPALEDLNASNPVLPNHYQSVENIVALEQYEPNTYTVINRPASDFVALYRSGDLRRTQYFKRVTSSTYNLLKGGTDIFACSFRSAEAYLTAAEAAARLGKTDVATDYLLQLAVRRYNTTAYAETASLVNAMSADELVQEILDERARELAFEGHRWYDLRRTTRPTLTHTYDGQTYTLTPDRYTMRFPTEAVEANPEIEHWNQ